MALVVLQNRDQSTSRAECLQWALDNVGMSLSIQPVRLPYFDVVLRFS